MFGFFLNNFNNNYFQIIFKLKKSNFKINFLNNFYFKSYRNKHKLCSIS